MKSIKILTVGALTSSLVVAAGCAGKGLKGMFSRNETAGYSTLEELEAREAAGSKEAVADSSGPRFAPWLSLGKKNTEETVASTEKSADASVDASSESKEEKKSLLRNPFRKQETIEPDPFLNGSSENTVADTGSKTGTQAESKAKSGPATRTASLSKDAGAAEKNARSAEEVPEITSKKPTTRSATPSASATAKTGKSAAPAEESDEELVARFEKHFQKNTLEAAEDAESLIVAGKDAAQAKKPAAKTAQPGSEAADRKLAELEDLLKSRKSKGTDRVSRAVAEESDDANETIRQLSGRGSEKVAKASAKSRSVQNSAEATANREFDRLFSDASHRMNEGTESSASADDVSVATANELFGNARSAVRKSTSRPVRSVSAQRDVQAEEEGSAAATSEDPSTTAPSRANEQPESKGFRWQSQNLRSRSQQFLKDTVSQSAQTLAGTARDNGLGNFLAPATAPDVPEPGESSFESQPLMIPEETVARSAAAGTSELSTPAGLQDDSFFTASNSKAAFAAGEASDSETAPAVPEQEAAAPAASSGSLLKRITLRSWILLIGGAVVVALLYVPGRKTQSPATTAQV